MSFEHWGDCPFNEKEALHKYPKILPYSRDFAGLECIAYEKYDGSNLMWRWNNSEGFYADGWESPTFRSGKSAAHLYPFEGAIDLFNKLLASDIDTFLTSECVSEARIFCEAFGEGSFAGEHPKGTNKIRLIDIWVKDKGFLDLSRFDVAFGFLPRIVYRGKLGGAFAEDLKKGRYHVNEGVVCKGVIKTTGALWRCKIKTLEWQERFKQMYGKEEV